MATNRFEWVEGLRPETPVTVAVRELGRILVDELSSWPPKVAWTDEAFRLRYSSLFESGAGRPGVAAIEEAAKRLAWEFARDFEAAAHYERNGMLDKACPLPSDRLACDFLFFYITEAYLQLIEHTDNRVRRSNVLDGLHEVTSRLRATWIGLEP